MNMHSDKCSLECVLKRKEEKSVEAYIHEKVWSNSQQLMIHQTQVLNLMCFTRLYHLWILICFLKSWWISCVFSNEKGPKTDNKIPSPSALYYILFFSLNKLCF